MVDLALFCPKQNGRLIMSSKLVIFMICCVCPMVPQTRIAGKIDLALVLF